jgi:hypothetical protein
MGSRSVFGALAALGFLLGAASSAHAQVPPLPNPMPWGQATVFAPPALATFGPEWNRIVRDTFATFKTFADLSRYGGPSSISPAVPMNVPSPLWGDTRTYIPTNPDLPTIRVGEMRATLVPVETSSTIVAAESRGVQGVLVGMRIDLPEIR